MQVSNVLGPGPAAASATLGNPSGSAAEVGRDTFLTLLVAQLEHQDPMSPMDNADFTAQLAQFSSLEQMERMSANLQALVQAQSTAVSIQAAGLVGQEVKAHSDTIQLRQGEEAALHYTLGADSQDVTLSIFNDAGNLVQTITRTAQDAGEHTVAWNGAGSLGAVLPDGEYIFAVAANDSQGNNVSTKTFIQGTVDGVEFEANQPFLRLAGTRVALDAVVSIERKTEEGSETPSQG